MSIWTEEWLDKGKKISTEYLKIKEDGKYLIITENIF